MFSSIRASKRLNLAGKDENLDENEGQETWDIFETLDSQVHEQVEALEHLKVEQQLHRCVHYDREAHQS